MNHQQMYHLWDFQWLCTSKLENKVQSSKSIFPSNLIKLYTSTLLIDILLCSIPAVQKQSQASLGIFWNFALIFQLSSFLNSSPFSHDSVKTYFLKAWRFWLWCFCQLTEGCNIAFKLCNDFWSEKWSDNICIQKTRKDSFVNHQCWANQLNFVDVQVCYFSWTDVQSRFPAHQFVGWTASDKRLEWW